MVIGPPDGPAFSARLEASPIEVSSAINFRFIILPFSFFTLLTARTCGECGENWVWCPGHGAAPAESFLANQAAGGTRRKSRPESVTEPSGRCGFPEVMIHVATGNGVSDVLGWMPGAPAVPAGVLRLSARVATTNSNDKDSKECKMIRGFIRQLFRLMVSSIATVLVGCWFSDCYAIHSDEEFSRCFRGFQPVALKHEA